MIVFFLTMLVGAGGNAGNQAAVRRSGAGGRCRGPQKRAFVALRRRACPVPAAVLPLWATGVIAFTANTSSTALAVTAFFFDSGVFHRWGQYSHLPQKINGRSTGDDPVVMDARRAHHGAGGGRSTDAASATVAGVGGCSYPRRLTASGRPVSPGVLQFSSVLQAASSLSSGANSRGRLTGKSGGPRSAPFASAHPKNATSPLSRG